MREVEIPHLPDGGLRGIAADGLPKESQFESESPAVRGFQIPSVVPPFGLKIRVIKMIARKFVTVSRQGDAVLRCKGLKEKQRGGGAREPILHGLPRPYSSAPRPAPGRDPQARLLHIRPSVHQEIGRASCRERV